MFLKLLNIFHIKVNICCMMMVFFPFHISYLIGWIDILCEFMLILEGERNACMSVGWLLEFTIYSAWEENEWSAHFKHRKLLRIIENSGHPAMYSNKFRKILFVYFLLLPTYEYIYYLWTNWYASCRRIYLK